MLYFLDIIYSPEAIERINQRVNQRRGQTPNRQRGLSDTLQFRLNSDSAVSNYTPTVDSASVDSVLNKGVADSIPNNDGIIDTLKASGVFTNGTAAGDDSSALIWTALVIIAALALCFCFIRRYRKSLSLRGA